MNTSRRSSIEVLALAAAVLATTSLVCTQAGADSRKPNVIVVFVDDLGWTDLGCYGSKFYETPNIDRLASNGLRLTQFYNTARCCPARASLLTGLYPHQAGIGMMVYRDYGDGYRGGLNDRCVTLAEVLKDSGYQTMLSGKWHAGHQPHMRPEVRGFERFTGIYTHVDSRRLVELVNSRHPLGQMVPKMPQPRVDDDASSP